ncbi:MAG TPA: L,D-transpeptidase [Ktedonobacter sp.]|nr:L,D-transpeptidase [Ktedonobacter sp.]
MHLSQSHKPVQHTRTLSRRATMFGRGTLVFLLLGLALLTTACGSSAQSQQATKDKTSLDSAIQQAQNIGVLSSQLAPVQKQEQQLSNTHAPFGLFNDSQVNNYYQNLAIRYTQLTLQVKAITVASQQQSQSQAQSAVQNFQTTLSRETVQKLPVQYFSQEYSQTQALLATAKYPKDYYAIIAKATSGTQALNLMASASSQLAIFNKTIAQMQAANLSVAAMSLQYQSDMKALGAGTSSVDFTNLSSMINVQYQQAVANSTAALPYVENAKLNTFQADIQQLKTYGGNISTYEQQYNTDRALMNKATGINDYTTFSKQIDSDIASMQFDVVKNEAAYLINQFHQEVNSWGQAHLFHDKYDGKTYMLDAGYTQPGIGSDLDNALANAVTTADFQAVVDEAQNGLFNLHLSEADYADSTPYNQVHATDQQMISRYQLQNKQVLMVSLTQQAMRVYDNGKLVNSFQVTTGREELPSVPGVWPVLARLSPTEFKSPDPQSSPYWYPPTHINYAIMYHDGGYFVHDSWWRADYGPNTQFPHVDSGGDAAFANSGSHGCVNMQEQQAAWVYSHTDWNTLIVIY